MMRRLGWQEDWRIWAMDLRQHISASIDCPSSEAGEQERAGVLYRQTIV